MARRIRTARILPVLGALAVLASLPGCVAGGRHYGGGYGQRSFSAYQPSYRQSYRPAYGYSSGYAPRGYGGGYGYGGWHRGG